MNAEHAQDELSSILSVYSLKLKMRLFFFYKDLKCVLCSNVGAIRFLSHTTNNSPSTRTLVTADFTGSLVPSIILFHD